METADPLAQLHDIVLPHAISWWPLAWGWWLLAGSLIALLLGIVFWVRRRSQRNQYRFLALRELNSVVQRYQDDNQVASFLQAINILLRRTAMTAQPRHYPVNIQGREWLQWLAQYCPPAHDELTQGVGQVLLTGPYQAAPEVDTDALHNLVALWLLQHHNQWQKFSRPLAPTPAKSEAH